MRTTICAAAAALLALSGCDSQQSNRFGSGSPGISTAPQAIAGWEGDQMRFVMVPIFDWGVAAGAEGRFGSDGNVSTDGRGREWWGQVKTVDGTEWDYRIGKSVARFGEEEFELAEGEVFILEEGFRIVQLKGSIAGSIYDAENLERLSKLLEDYHAEQSGASR